MSLEYNPKIIPLAKTLRKNATRQENHLWYDFLRTYKVRFQRQKTIGNKIVDFFCHKAMLVIEVDGSQHFSPEGLESDCERTLFLESFGLTVKRYTNLEIDKNFEAVCEDIDLLVDSLSQLR